MLKRIKLADRCLPTYSNGEEIMNMVTHIVGGGLGIAVLLLCLLHPNITNHPRQIVGCVIYGASMIIVYTISSIYHGLPTNTSKKVLQILDHCAIYLLIAGTYTPILLSRFLDRYLVLGISLLVLQWGCTAIAITLKAIDLKKYNLFAMTCYIGLGWSIIFVLPQFLKVVSTTGFLYLLAGGISYSIGAILFAIGTKIRWMHSIFHILVVLGSLLQFISIYFYIL